MDWTKVDAEAFHSMIVSGARELSLHAKEVNDLNVFPIPDGDTGDNMSMTIGGGASLNCSFDNGIGGTSKDVANAMLLSARGNSGVILSQFFAGIADGLSGLDEAGVENMKDACKAGVKRAYDSVMTPTEGTILTVAKDATRYACEKKCETIDEFLANFLDEAYRSLERTPELLAQLKEANVVDSGAMGLIYIMKGMYRCLQNDSEDTASSSDALTNESSLNGSFSKQLVNVDMFSQDMELEFGYCTELLIRLQNSKTNVEEFDISLITNYLEKIGGDSVVCFKNDSIVKLHVHTMTPYKVLEHCQKYGEFLTVKIENMMLQHNEAKASSAEKSVTENTLAEKNHAENTPAEKKLDGNSQPAKSSRKKYAVVTVANGNGIKSWFEEYGVYVIEGGQTMNPSSQDFIDAFDKVNADNIFVLPNNGNIFMAAKQASELYSDADVRVIPTKTIGDGYAALSMLSFDSNDTDVIENELNEAMQGVRTLEISPSNRDANINGFDIKEGDYLGIIGKDILGCKKSPCEAAIEVLEKEDLSERFLTVIIRGKMSTEEESSKIYSYIKKKYPMMEVVETFGEQDIFNFYIVME